MASTPSVLFVCVHNAGRSQMAQGFLTHLAGDRIKVRSAGTEPGGRINPAAIEAMAEVGIDITAQTPKILTPDTVQSSDVVITMGCGDNCPYFPGVDYRDWKLDDPMRPRHRRRPTHPRRNSRPHRTTHHRTPARANLTCPVARPASTSTPVEPLLNRPFHGFESGAIGLTSALGRSSWITWA